MTRTRPKNPARRPSASAAAPRTGPSSIAADAPSAFANYWSAWPDLMRRIGEQTVHDLQRDAELETDEVQHLSTPQDLWSRQAEFAGEVWMRMARGSVQFAATMLDAQSAWFRDAESRFAEAMRPWLGDGRPLLLGSAQPLFDPPQPLAPAQALEAMQRFWGESTKLWFNAISHDLQGGGAKAG
jgi:hypothetical protein